MEIQNLKIDDCDVDIGKIYKHTQKNYRLSKGFSLDRRFLYSRITQLVEWPAVNRYVAGSSPAVGAHQLKQALN